LTGSHPVLARLPACRVTRALRRIRWPQSGTTGALARDELAPLNDAGGTVRVAARERRCALAARLRGSMGQLRGRRLDRASEAGRVWWPGLALAHRPRRQDEPHRTSATMTGPKTSSTWSWCAHRARPRAQRRFLSSWPPNTLPGRMVGLASGMMSDASPSSISSAFMRARRPCPPMAIREAGVFWSARNGAG